MYIMYILRITVLHKILLCKSYKFYWILIISNYIYFERINTSFSKKNHNIHEDDDDPEEDKDDKDHQFEIFQESLWGCAMWDRDAYSTWKWSEEGAGMEAERTPK